MKKIVDRFRHRATKMNCVSVIAMGALGAMPGVAISQEDTEATSSQASVEVAAPKEEGDAPTLEKVVVTGSRIAGRSILEVPSPVTLIDREIIENSSYISIDDVIARSPALSAGVGLSNQSIGQDVGAAFANLRGLGESRTLTLIDGRRRVPGNGFHSGVDLNAIPPGMVERVEIVTGGTSAAYGADSISGVINVILKKDFEGLEFGAKYGQPEESPGGESKQFRIHGGTKFGDGRGHASVGFFYDTYTGFDDVDRSYARGDNLSTLRPNMNNTGPNDGIPDNILITDPRINVIPRTGAFFHNGMYRTVDENGMRFLRNDFAQVLPNGSLFDIYASGGDGFAFEDLRPLRASLDRFSIMSRLSYLFTPRIEGFAELDLAFAKGRTNDEVVTHGLYERQLIVTRDNPLLHGDLTSYMDANGITALNIYRSAYDLGRVKTATDRQTMTGVLGLRGDVAESGYFSNWNWEASVQYGRGEVDTAFEDAIFRDRLYKAYDVISDPASGNAVCRDVAARAAGCLPLRAIGAENNVTDERFRSWLYTDTRSRLITEQSVASATFSGNLATLPAGDVQAVVGGVYRKERLDFQEDPSLTENRIYVLGPFLTQSSRSGEQNIKEGFVEVLVPVLADMPFAKSLSIEGSARYSDYSTFGSTFTWKAGAVYSPVEDVRFRYTSSKSVRAPTLNEIYSPGTPGSYQIMDPCDVTQRNLGTEYRDANCLALGLGPDFRDNLGANTIINTGGNENLDAETGLSWTAGMVLTPRFLPGFSLSVDLYKITLDDAIGTTDPVTTIRQCVDLPSLDNVFCPLVHRSAETGQLDSIDNRRVNFGQMQTRGLDWQAAYRFDLSDVASALQGNLSVGVGGTRLKDLTVIADPTKPNQVIVYDGELAYPKTRINANISYFHGPLSLNWFTNYIGATVVDRQPTSQETMPLGLESVASQVYHYFSGRYELNDRYSLTLGVNNVLGRSPPKHPYITGSGNFGGGRGLYDNQGRVYFIGFDAKF